MIDLVKDFYNSFIHDHRKFWLFVLILIILFFLGQATLNNNPNVNKNNKQYVNSIYMSDGRIYNNYLNQREKDMYDFIMSRIKKNKRVTKKPLKEYGCSSHQECYSLMSIATDAIWIDHPELLSFASFDYSYDPRSSLLTFRIRKSFKLPLMDKIGEMIINYKIKKIQRATKDMTDKEKIIYVYNWIGDNATYDRIFTLDSKNQTIYNVFINHNAVCAGFAKTAQVIFQAIGINSYSIEGTTSDLHMWNIVEVDGEYYYFDSTYAAAIKRDHPMYYDGLIQSKMEDHKATHPERYPTLSTRDLFTDGELK